MMLSRYLVILMLLILPLGCSVEEIQNNQKIIVPPCSEEDVVTGSEANIKILGEWRWMYINCEASVNERQQDPYKGLTIIIKENGKVEFFQDGEFNYESEWVIASEGEDLLFSTFPVSRPLIGKLVFCNDWFSMTGGQHKMCRHNFLRMQ